jgi:hypothetical protein
LYVELWIPVEVCATAKVEPAKNIAIIVFNKGDAMGD